MVQGLRQVFLRRRILYETLRHTAAQHIQQLSFSPVSIQLNINTLFISLPHHLLLKLPHRHSLDYHRVHEWSEELLFCYLQQGEFDGHLTTLERSGWTYDQLCFILHRLETVLSSIHLVLFRVVAIVTVDLCAHKLMQFLSLVK